MKAKSSMGSAWLIAKGWETGSWESKLISCLDWLEFHRSLIIIIEGKKNTTEEDAARLKLTKREVKKIAVAVGALIAQELVKGNDDVLQSVSNGFKNLKKGKPWNPSKKRSDKVMRVFEGVIEFEALNYRKPTRKELAEFVGLSPADTSAAITLMGIEDQLLDGRQERHKKARRKS